MSDKTPGEVLCEKMRYQAVFLEPWNDLSNNAKQHYEQWASAVIAHVRPQIEAEARAAAAEECAVISWSAMMDYCKKNGMHPGDNGDLFSHISEIRAIASAPPGYVCVPVEPTQEMLDAASSAAKNEDGSYKMGAVLMTKAQMYKDMIEARPK